MYNCVGTFESGNYVINVCKNLEKRGYVFEVIATPCQIAKGGCGYSLKFPEEHKELVVSVAKELGYIIGDMYRIVPMFNKNSYEKLEY